MTFLVTLFCSIYVHLGCRRVKVEGQIVWLLEDELGSSVEEEKEGG